MRVQWVCIMLLALAGCGPSDRTSTQSPALAAAASAVKARAAECAASKAEMVGKFNALISATRFTEAIEVFGDCARFRENADLQRMIADAERQRAGAIITNTKLDPQDRVAAYRRLAMSDAAAAKTFEPMIPALEQAIEKKRIADEKRAAAEDLKRRKREGVRIGMTQDDVLKSNWGRPEHVNRTTTAYGTREQWVYGSRSYLYFRDGILESIQN